MIARTEAERVRAALRDLPEPQAEVIALAFFGGLTHSEIAVQLDLPPGTVKGRIRLGLEKLRRSLRFRSSTRLIPRAANEQRLPGSGAVAR